MDRLTDTSKYTGSHKERFDESGKGKGKEGRETLWKTLVMWEITKERTPMARKSNEYIFSTSCAITCKYVIHSLDVVLF